MAGPLEGIVVLDFTQYVSGPFCSMMLGDMGAEVIKVEDVEHGDIYRVQGPNFINGEATSFLGVNRSKKSLTLNLKDPRGRQIAQDLASRSDVLLENFKPGVADRLGLGYEELSKQNPKLIYASISGYGQTGRESKRGGYDLMAQGRSGMMWVTGSPDSPPAKVGVPVVDMGASMYTAIGIVASLFARQTTGKGQQIDVALLDTAVSWFGLLALEYQATGKVPGKLGSASPLFAPYQAFKAKDGYINVIGTGGKGQWERFCQVLGHEEWINDERFMDNPKRIANLDELTRLIDGVLKTQPVNYWIKHLSDADLACDPIQSLDQMMVDPQVQERDMIVEVNHPRAGRIKLIGNPIKFSKTKCTMDRLPPQKGENSEEILMRLGFTKDQINDLRENKVI